MRAMKIPVVCALMVVLLAGCPHEEYVLELSVEKGVLCRKLTVKGVERDISVETLEALGRAYGKKLATKGLKRVSVEGQGPTT